MSTPPLHIIDLGRQGYAAVHRLQRELADRRIAGEIRDDILLLVQHDPVVTLGRGTRESSLPFSPSVLASKGLDVAEVERGGDVTYHGPGQLVGYPIVNLQNHRPDLHWYLRQLEAGLISALETLRIPAERRAGLTGVWTGARKIASIGIHVRQWVTTHGFALNVLDEESGFDLIIPCGIAGVEMTSVEREGAWADAADGDTSLHGSELWQTTREAVIQEIAKALSREPVPGALTQFLPTVPA
jgi:lipoyl(octanoyl) transferase